MKQHDPKYLAFLQAPRNAEAEDGATGGKKRKRQFPHFPQASPFFFRVLDLS